MSKISFAIVQTLMRKVEKRFDRALLEDVNRSMKLIRHHSRGCYLEAEEIAERKRQPMIQLLEYSQRHGSAASAHVGPTPI